MSRIGVWLVLCASATVAVCACGDDDGGTMPGMDAGERDGGVAVDAPPVVDAPPLRPDADIEYPACDPLAGPTACPSPERCAFTFEPSTPGYGRFSCRLEEGVAVGERCMYSAFFPDMGRRLAVRDNCAGGSMCGYGGVADGAPFGECRPVCSVASDCAAGEVCQVSGAGALGAPPLARAGVCMTPSSCDRSAGTGCAEGEECRFGLTTDGRVYPQCFPPGDDVEGEPCGGDACDDGLSCLPPFDDDGLAVFGPSPQPRCRAICDTAGTDTCSAGSACVAAQLAGGGEVGVCIRDEVTVGGTDRPARVVVPDDYDGITPKPLLLLLHGFYGNGPETEEAFDLTAFARGGAFFLVAPTGTYDEFESRYWNATDACCDFDALGVDDSGYLRGLIDEMAMRYEIDPARVYVYGVSNGGYMAYRLACDHADVITAVAVQAGATVLDEMDCAAARPVSVLHIHGDADVNVAYGGGSTPVGAYPGAVASVERWATRAGCDLGAATDGTPFDLVADIAGDETLPRSYATGCAPGIAVDLWTMRGAAHTPLRGPDWTTRFVDWLTARRR